MKPEIKAMIVGEIKNDFFIYRPNTIHEVEVFVSRINGFCNALYKIGEITSIEASTLWTYMTNWGGYRIGICDFHLTEERLRNLNIDDLIDEIMKDEHF